MKLETTMLPQGSAVYSLAIEKAINAALDAGKPRPSDAEQRLRLIGRSKCRAARSHSFVVVLAGSRIRPALSRLSMEGLPAQPCTPESYH
jgi:hypothetical protein